MGEQTSGMSPQSLRRKLIHILKSKGILQDLKANLRQKLIAEMHSKSPEHCRGASSDFSSLNHKIVYSLCLEYLRRRGYTYTLSVLVPEAGLQDSEAEGKPLIFHQLQFLSLSNPNASLLDNITSYITSVGCAHAEDKWVQVGLEYNGFLYESQLEKIDAKYDFQQHLDVEKLEAFKRNTLNEMKDEIELSANAKVKEKQLQLEEVYAIRKVALDEREKQLNEVMAKSREANERTGFLQRQTLSAEMETCRIQTQKARQAEADLERQRKELHDNFCRRRAQLQADEQELLARKREFDDIVKQEVERLRKSDEVELLNKRKELELTETRLTIEKNALEAQRDHILALQEEISQKSALFSQMEITDYETLKLKLRASKNEINTLKESLGQALKEVEGLRQGAATAASERNLLVATRQENESLRAALEQERTNNNKERINLNVKIEELREEKSRLEERVRLQESEVSRLRGRLADQRRARPSDSRVCTVTATPASTGVKGDFYSESQTPAVSAKTVSTAASSATVEMARERLKALEQESVKLEEALGRWKEEISIVPPMPKASTEAVAKCVQPNSFMLLRSGLSTAYLNSFRTASSIPSLGQFPPSWPLPFMTSDSKDPLQEDTIPRVTTPVVTTPSADIVVNHQKGSTFIISKRSTLSSIPTMPDEAKKVACEVPERQSSVDHSDDSPLMITSQGATQSSVAAAAAVCPVDPVIKEGSRCEAVPLASSDRRTSCQLTEQAHHTYGRVSNSSERCISRPLTVVDGDRNNDSSAKQVDTDEGGEEVEKHFVEVSPHGSQREEEEGEKRLSSSFTPGIDPMILKYMKVLQEQRPAQEPEVEPACPIVMEGQDPEATKTRPSFGDFLTAQQKAYSFYKIIMSITRSLKISNNSLNKIGDDPPLRTVNNANFGRISQYARLSETDDIFRGSVDGQTRLLNNSGRNSSQLTHDAGSSTKTLPVPSETFEQIRTEHKMIGRLFCDPAFPADETSLYYSRRPPCSIVWMRPPEIVSAMCRTDVLGIAPRKMHFPEFIAGGSIRLGDLRQGELGDCWVVAALASMVTQPRLTMRSIPQGQSFRAEWYAGCFCFRFWQFGAWEEVIIDDRLPVRPGGRPLFIHSSRHTEFWPALLEKAYANLIHFISISTNEALLLCFCRLSGSYEALNVGLIGDAMDDIIGGLTESYCLAPGEDQGMRPPPDLDDILIKAFDRRSLITARIKASTKGNPCSGFVLPQGFVPGQAFGLTDCRKLRLTDVAGSRLVRLVRLRNLWPSARVGWVGAWSEGSSEWLSLPPEDRIKVGLVKGEGEFWMSMEDFLANFDYLDICHVLESPSGDGGGGGGSSGGKLFCGSLATTGNHQAPVGPAVEAWTTPRFFGRWVRGVTAGGRPFVRASHWANPQFVVRLPTPDVGDPEGLAALVVALLQSDARPLRHRAPRLLSIGFVLYRLPPGASPPMTRHFFETTSHVASVDYFYDSREVVKRFRLVPGVYLLVPCTYAADQPGEFLLRVLFEQPDRALECALGRIDVGSISPQALADPDPQFDTILPRIRRLFYEAGGDSMAVDAFQLDSILNTVLKEDHRLPYAMVSTDACRALIAMRNDRYTGRLVESEFQPMWSLLRCWSRMFAAFDPQRTGHITCLDFRILIEQVGLYLPHTILARIVHRFADAEWRISYGTFIQIMALLTRAMLSRSFNDHLEIMMHSTNCRICQSSVDPPSDVRSHIDGSAGVSSHLQFTDPPSNPSERTLPKPTCTNVLASLLPHASRLYQRTQPLTDTCICAKHGFKEHSWMYTQ
ncbi:Calpain-9 [Taenia solium]|eukprot:TsM_000204100 transcript=TsM_000204100 gene=TsM_000204100